jgi:hypothetical protein
MSLPWTTVPPQPPRWDFMSVSGLLGFENAPRDAVCRRCVGRAFRTQLPSASATAAGRSHRRKCPARSSVTDALGRRTRAYSRTCLPDMGSSTHQISASGRSACSRHPG